MQCFTFAQLTKKFIRDSKDVCPNFNEALEKLELHAPRGREGGPFKNSMELNKGQSLVLAVLLAHANDFGTVTGLPKSKIVSLTGLNMGSVTQYLKQLKKIGYIRKTYSGFNDSLIFGRQVSVYCLSLDLVFDPGKRKKYRFSYLFDTKLRAPPVCQLDVFHDFPLVDSDVQLMKQLSRQLTPLGLRNPRKLEMMGFHLASLASILISRNTSWSGILSPNEFELTLDRLLGELGEELDAVIQKTGVDRTLSRREKAEWLSEGSHFISNLAEKYRQPKPKMILKLIVLLNAACCSGSMILDTSVGGKITTINEVSDDQKTTFLYS